MLCEHNKVNHLVKLQNSVIAYVYIEVSIFKHCRGSTVPGKRFHSDTHVRTYLCAQSIHFLVKLLTHINMCEYLDYLTIRT